MVEACSAVIDIWPFIGLASTLTLSLIAFLYMVGRILQKSELESVAKTELNQFFLSFIIVLGVLGLSSMVCTITPSIVQSTVGRGDQFSITSDYLSTLIYAKGLPTIQRLWISSFLLESLSSIEYKTRLPSGTLKFSPGAVLKPFAKSLSLFNSLFTILIGSLQAQLVFIQLAEAFSLTLILPIGLVLRTIPGLRKGGSFLIALSFGFYVVFPLTYVMNYSIYKSIDPNFNSLVETKVNPLQVFKISSDILAVLNYFDEFSILIPQATFLPVLSLTVTLAFIKYFAKFLSDIS